MTFCIFSPRIVSTEFWRQQSALLFDVGVVAGVVVVVVAGVVVVVVDIVMVVDAQTSF